VYPEYPPRVRIEWLIASSRVVLAGGGLLAVAISPFGPGDDWRLAYTIGWYLIYSLCVLALVWTPVRFAPAWGLSLHLFDLSAFSLFTLFTGASSSPFFIYFTFLVICGTLRWDIRGAAWTAIASIVVSAATGLYTSQVLHLRPFATNAFVVRSVHLAVTAALIAYLGAYHHRFQREIGRIISWPRRVPRQPRDVFLRAGWSKQDVREYIFETARVRRRQWRDVGKAVIAARRDEDQIYAALRTPDDLLVISAGGPAGGFTAIVPPWYGNKSLAVTRVIPTR